MAKSTSGLRNVSAKSTNPKHAIGVTKVPLSLIPPVFKAHTAMALGDGARKYQPYNWRRSKVNGRIYIEAAMRHLDALLDGEDLAKDSRAKHAGHVAACMAIYLDAESLGQLIDDRPIPGKASETFEALHETIKASLAAPKRKRKSRRKRAKTARA